MKTRSELVTEFRRLIDQPNTGIISPTTANAEINKAYKELVAKIVKWNDRFYRKTGTLTTVASTAYVAYPSDAIFINRIIDSDKETLPHLDLELFELSEAEGTPHGWDAAGRYVYFHPTPSAALSYTAYYTYFPTELSLDSSTPEFIPGYEDIIALKAAINSKMIRDQDVRDMVMNDYRDMEKDLRFAAMTQHTGASRRVIPSDYEYQD